MSRDELRPKILAVDDEPQLAELYRAWLRESYRVETATSGEAALERMDRSVDVVLLDRRMPGLTGDDVLTELRDRGFDCRVAMITAVEPDLDVVDMGFDTYIVKPVTRGEVRRTVASLLAREAYDERVRRYFALASKQAVLASSLSREERAASDEYTALESEIDAAREAADASLPPFSEDDPIYYRVDDSAKPNHRRRGPDQRP